MPFFKPAFMLEMSMLSLPEKVMNAADVSGLFYIQHSDL